MRELQSGGAGVVVCSISGQGFLRSAHDPVWIRLPGYPAHYSAAIPPERQRSLVADPAPVLSLGKHSWIMVHRHDHLLDHCCRGDDPIEVGDDRERALDGSPEKKSAARLGREC